MYRAKVLILIYRGINCDRELHYAYKLAGAKNIDCVDINKLFSSTFSIHDYNIINFPGGFSYADSLGAGNILASKIRYQKLKNNKTLLDELKIFIEKNYVLGICNGFQVLTKLNLLPNISKMQGVSLEKNLNNRFEDRWVYLRVNKNTRSPFLKGISKLYLPIRHEEGRLIIKNDIVKKAIISKNLNSISYCDENYNESSIYPYNPNGSELNCAALEDSSSHVLGIMPHPEAYLSNYENPNWPNNTLECQNGIAIFKNILRHVEFLI